MLEDEFWNALRKLYKGRYPIFIVLAFSCGQAKTIRIRYAGVENKYPDICGRAFNRNTIPSLHRYQPLIFLETSSEKSHSEILAV